MQNTLSLTPAALTQVQKLCTAQQGKGLYITIKKTGCSGYAYDLSIINNPPAEEVIFPQANGLFVAISKENLPFVIGSTIDYVREGLNAHFKFLNPNEKGTCGCGESFSV